MDNQLTHSRPLRTVLTSTLMAIAQSIQCQHPGIIETAEKLCEGKDYVFLFLDRSAFTQLVDLHTTRLQKAIIESFGSSADINEYIEDKRRKRK